jgi:hypothetical protein
MCRLCEVGGHIALDHAWMQGIRTVRSFIRANRSDFVELRTGDPDVCLFEKIGQDQPWDHFRPFAVAASDLRGT